MIRDDQFRNVSDWSMNFALEIYISIYHIVLHGVVQTDTNVNPRTKILIRIHKVQKYNSPALHRCLE